jgi:hypothetical protein
MLRTFKLHLEELSDRVVPTVVHSEVSPVPEMSTSVLNTSDTLDGTSGLGQCCPCSGQSNSSTLQSISVPVEISWDDYHLWSEWLTAISVWSQTMPISHTSDAKEQITSLAICETGDIKIDTAYRYSQAFFDKTIEMPSGRANWEAAIAELEKVADGCLKQIVITGHGSTQKAGPFAFDQIRDSNSLQSRFLKLLKQKAAEGATIELRACSTCSERDQQMLTRMAELTGLTVIGYDDTYAVKPHGQQWIAKPDGTVEKGEKYPAYKDSWVHYFENLVTGNKDKEKK